MTSTSPDPAEVETLAAALRQRFRDAVVEISTFPSGSVFLDVRRRGRAWVMTCSPSSQQFGVDELADEESFLTSYAYTTTRLDEAAQILLDLLAGNLPTGRRRRRSQD